MSLNQPGYTIGMILPFFPAVVKVVIPLETYSVIQIASAKKRAFDPAAD